ncbi:hypothetical protein BRC81_12130 [Halobacteriales archaeon QS_1_68_20]|nr:MAG: hypothetical protein BRC81_12130 [Halobacteriales archaeon QS_1_68_20]
MTAVELAFERGGAHALALVGLAVGIGVALGLGQWRLGGVVVTVTAWVYVLAYLAYVWVRFTDERRGRDWSRGQQFVAGGVIVANDSRVGTAPIPVVLVGVLATATTLGLLFTTVDVLALPTWVLLVLPLPTFPLLLPLAWGKAAYDAQRFNDVVDLQLA